MKAYICSNDEYSTVVFAETRGKARTMAKANDLFDFTDWIDISVRRAPEFDSFAEQGYVPKEVLIKHGWWWECKCGTPQYEETAIVINDSVFCEKCVDKANKFYKNYAIK